MGHTFELHCGVFKSLVLFTKASRTSLLFPRPLEATRKEHSNVSPRLSIAWFDLNRRGSAMTDNEGLVELEGGHTFRMHIVADVFRKLYRERRRFENADGSRQDQTDAVINFAITAWHLSEWVWRQYGAKLRDQIPVQAAGDFQRYLKENCRHLAVCDVIANAAKHGGRAHQRAGRPDVETVLAAHPIDDGSSQAPSVLVVAMMKREWSLKIRVDGKTEHARVVLRNVEIFWHRFLQQHCYPDT